MKEFFEAINFKTKSLQLIDIANGIIEEYQQDGLTLTLRQLYYQFVARDYLPNVQKSYDNLGRIISNARIAGLIDWDAIEDRTRFLRGRTNWDNPLQMIRSGTRKYSIEMWNNQDYRIEVWIEKDALIGVIERVCFENDVDYFACRGYVSQSELYTAGKRIADYRDEGQETIVIHLGDHDPSGIDMSRDNEERLSMFAAGPVTVERIALNYDQVKQYNPPPNPAKVTDSRAGAYIRKHGKSSWELDALEPRVLQKLISERINVYKDVDMWAIKEAELAHHKAHLQNIQEILQKEYP